MKRHIFLGTVWLSCCSVALMCSAQNAPKAENTSPAPVSIKPADSHSAATFRVGLKSIAVPSPAGLQETGPDFRVLFEKDTPDTNRLVAAFLLPERVIKLPSREGEPGRYAFLQTLRQAEFVDVDEATFKQVADEVAKQFGTTSSAPPMDVKELQDEFNHKLKAEGGTSEISMDKPVSLGTFFSKTNCLGLGMVINVAAGDNKKKVIVGTTILRVQNRLLYGGVFAEYTGDDALAWVRTTSEQWADAILKANP